MAGVGDEAVADEAEDIIHLLEQGLFDAGFEDGFRDFAIEVEAAQVNARRAVGGGGSVFGGLAGFIVGWFGGGLVLFAGLETERLQAGDLVGLVIVAFARRE
ncbi:MAG: hypothetical protein WCQ21_13780 [Verrucomicrobiota bacterium]